MKSKIWFRFASGLPNTGKHSLDPAVMDASGNNAYKVLIISDKDYRAMSHGLFSLKP